MLGAGKIATFAKLAAIASGPAPVYGAVNFSSSSYSSTGLTTTATDNKYMTVAFTFYLPSSATGSFMDLFSIRLGTGSGEIGYQAILQSTRLHNYFINNTGGSTGQTYGDYEITTSNAWHQIVYYHDATSFANCKYFVDGVDRTANLLNGPSFGEPAMANADFNWANTNTTISIGNGISGFDVAAGTNFDGRFSQLYIGNTAGAPDITKFWDSTDALPRDLGSFGNSTGLPRPLIYHYGSTTTFPTNRGTLSSYTLTPTNSPTNAEGPAYGTNGWYLFLAPTGEQLTSHIGSHQLGVMGYNTGNKIRVAAAISDLTVGAMTYLLPAIFDPTTKQFDIKTKVSTGQDPDGAPGYTGFTGRKAVSEMSRNIGTADATNWGITYTPYNDSVYNYVLPYSMSSDGTIAFGTAAASMSPSIGTSAEGGDLDYDGINNGLPTYVFFLREDAGNQTRMAFTRSGSTLTKVSGNATYFNGNRSTVIGANINQAQANFISFQGNASGARAMTITTGGTIYDSGDIAHGVYGKIHAVKVSSNKYFIYGLNAPQDTYIAKILNVTFSASGVPSVSFGSEFQEETTANRPATAYNYGTRIVASATADQVILFYTVNSTDLYAKVALVSGDSISWASGTFLGSFPNGATGLDVQQAYIDASNNYIMGMTKGAVDSENQVGPMSLFAVTYKNIVNTFMVVTPASGSVNEGSSLTFNITGSGITNGTYYWTVNTNAGDFGTSSGSFTITSNTGSFSVTPTADLTTEGAETFTVSVRTGSTSGPIVASSSSVTINDTSQTVGTTSMSLAASNSSLSSLITIPSGIATGDVAILWDMNTSNSNVTPTGWTQISSAGTTGVRLNISYKQLSAGEASTNISGSGGTTRKVMLVFRGNNPPTSIIPTVYGQQGTAATPGAQTIIAPAGSLPYIFFSGHAATSTGGSRSWNTGAPTEYQSRSTSSVYARYDIYNSSGASNTTVSMTDAGINAMISFRILFS